MKIGGKTYTITYDESTTTVTFQGVLRLHSVAEGRSITDLLNQVADSAPETIQLDFEQLQLMNSTGLSILSKFMLKMREQNTSKVILRASEKYFWQKDLIRGLQRFMPGSELRWV
jgi:hypothetical protein